LTLVTIVGQYNRTARLVIERDGNVGKPSYRRSRPVRKIDFAPSRQGTLLSVLDLDPAIEAAGAIEAVAVLRDQTLEGALPDFARLQCCAGCVVPKTKLLARNIKTWRGCSGSPSAPLSDCTRGQTNITWQNRTMTRHDAPVWLSLAGLFAVYRATLWVFLMAAIRG
jgi:hypothetical protein